ncbi:lamin tail domain-containing protein [Patescibacteria group bacterium]|nr:lamin tail domain-containing protein [Patescibacteria group bacterium]MBU0776899.1 lamin tail domain-containing protein [Patescibacteria group bacterium]MBU0846306.1 lamin tail domain-containing protein [Patescibacteria group bacterium]MBU0922570.1 lamin tail domain-containing protein [Patescibacteria group bacterium]MBU1066768.1 lamin tail domain-containing protein [Patescibacteria group bacterium]
MRNIIFFFLIFFVFTFIFTSKVSAQVEIKINEVLPNPSGDDKEGEWIEIYNSSDTPFVIDGYKLSDRNDKQIVLSGSVEKWLVIYPKGESGFAVANSDSTTITLLGPDDSEIDKFIYVGSSEDKSWGRIPDGGGINSEKLNPTPGGANEAPPIPTPTSNPTPNPTSTPVPTESPTPKPTVLAVATKRPTITPRPVVNNNEGDDGDYVLGLRDGLSSPSPDPEEEVEKKFPFMAGLFLVGGTGLIGIAGYTFIKNGKKEYNKDSKKKRNDGFNKIEIKGNDSKESS